MLPCHIVQHPLQVKQQGSGITPCRKLTDLLAFYYTTPSEERCQHDTGNRIFDKNKKVAVSIEVHQRINRK